MSQVASLAGREDIVDALQAFANQHRLAKPDILRDNWEVSARSGELLLRASQADPNPAVAFANACTQADIAVMQPRLAPQQYGRWWVCGWEWLYETRTPSLVDVGRLAAKLERVTASDDLRDIGPMVWVTDYLDKSRVNLEHSSTVNNNTALARHYETLRRLEAQAAKRWQEANYAHVLVHGDLSAENIVCTPTPTMVDPDGFGRGPAGWDLTRIAAAKYLHGGDNEAPAAWEAYRQEGGVLTAGDINELVNVFLLRRTCWYLWRATEAVVASPQQAQLTTEVAGQVQELVERAW